MKKQSSKKPFDLTFHDWIDHTTKLIQIEKQAEMEDTQSQLKQCTPEESQAQGNSLLGLCMEENTVSLLGKSTLTFKHRRKEFLPAHRFGVGDVVAISLLDQEKNSTKKPCTGVVCKATDKALDVMLDEEDSLESIIHPNHLLRVDRLANDITYKKLASVLEKLKKDVNSSTSLEKILFEGEIPQFNEIVSIKPFNVNINPSQIKAIENALAAKTIALIHGPPGTGKTTTLIELVQQAIKRNLRVLVCAPSNIAVDNMLIHLSKCSASREIRPIRIGHPARLQKEVLIHCLDAKIKASDGYSIINDIRDELVTVQKKIMDSKNKRTRQELRKESKILRKDIKVRGEKALQEIVKGSNMVFCTNIGASSHILKDEEFDILVIDEAAQALEASCWIPILKAKRIVLAGDHCQLPPTVKSKIAEKEGLGITLFDRIINKSSNTAVFMLDTQYRMNEKISRWSSDSLYEGKLKSSESVANHLLSDLNHVELAKDAEENSPLMLIDTTGCSCDENQNEKSLSRYNEGEVQIVSKHVRFLISLGLKPKEIAVISPYNAQVDLLKSNLLAEYPDLEIRSVDGFQGCEKEAVVMSFVRSNQLKEVGFLADDRRINVAITRAKRHCALVCDTETVRRHKFINNLINHFEEHGVYRLAQEYLNTESIHVEFEDVISQFKEETTSAKNIHAKMEIVSAIPIKTNNEEKNSEPILINELNLKKTAIMQEQVHTQEKEKIREDQNKVFEKASEDCMKEINHVKIRISEEDEEVEIEEESVDNPVGKFEVTKSCERSKLSKKSKKKKKSNKKQSKDEKLDPNLEGDQLLESVISRSDLCSMGINTCKTNVKLMGTTCAHCKQRYCFKHSMPEIHGCGQAVRNACRKEFLSVSSTKQNTKNIPRISSSQTQALKSSLRKKIEDQEKNRKASQKKIKE